MKKTTHTDTEQPKYDYTAAPIIHSGNKVRWSDEELIALLGRDSFNKANVAREGLQRERSNIEWILVPSMNLQMVTVIGAEEFDKGQNGVGSIIHDNLHKAIK